MSGKITFEPDFKCPYCRAGSDADHERFFDNEAHIECKCGKIYVVIREITFHFEARRVPCLNNRRYHKWRKMDNGMERCMACDEKRGNLSREYLEAMGVSTAGMP